MTDVQEATAAERRDLAAVLAGLTPAAWDTPTLCAGWRVREVVAHLTMQYRMSMPKVLLGVLRAGGNFNRMADRQARQDAAALTPDELTGSLRDNADNPWSPPGGGPTASLTHDVVHGLDFTVPLGIERRVPEDRLRLVLDGVEAKRLRSFGVDLTGIRLQADDLDWHHGSGTPLTGAAQDLVLLLYGRKLPAGHLHGDPAPRFTHHSP